MQALLKQTDRGIESDLQGNGVYQVFCGRTLVENWHIPDHTNIEKFRNRLTPETQRKIANYISQVADTLTIDLKKIAKTSKENYFLAKNTAKEVKGKVFQSLFDTVKEQLTPVIQYFSSLGRENRQGKRVWTCFSTWKNCRQLFYYPGMHFCSQEDNISLLPKKTDLRGFIY